MEYFSSSQWPSDQEDDVFSFFMNQTEISSLSEYFQDSSSIAAVTPTSNLIMNQTLSSCTSTDQVHPVVAPSIPSAPPSNIISFGKQELLEAKDDHLGLLVSSHHGFAEWNFKALADLDGSGKAVKGTKASSSCTSEHVIAERNRREKLSQLFIALSAIIPGPKKTDKASLLSDTISYVKQLETKVKILEEQGGKDDLIKNSQSSSPDTTIIITSTTSPGSDVSPSSAVSVLEMETRQVEKTVLLRIHCEKHKGVLVKALSEVEKHRLSVLSISAMPSQASTLNITIICSIEEGFSMTMKDLVRDLNSGLSLSLNQHTRNQSIKLTNKSASKGSEQLIRDCDGGC